MKIILSIIFIISCTCLKAQVQIGVMLPSTYLVTDTARTTPNGTTFKTTTPLYKKRGYVIYTIENGVFKYVFLDSQKQPLPSRYMVTWDDRDSKMIPYKPIWANPQQFDVRFGVKVDSLNLRTRQ